jgi:hypothetical protein
MAIADHRIHRHACDEQEEKSAQPRQKHVKRVYLDGIGGALRRQNQGT